MREVGEDLNEVRLQAEAAWIAARVHTVTGEVEAAVAACRRAVELAVDPVAKATATAGWARPTSRAATRKLAIEHLEDAHRAAPASSAAPAAIAIGRSTACSAPSSARRTWTRATRSGARHVAEEALAIARKGGWLVAVGYAERALGRVELAAGRLDEAERALEAALAHVHRERGAGAGGALPDGPGRAPRGARRPSAAAAELRAAHDLFTQMRVPRLVERVSRSPPRWG